MNPMTTEMIRDIELVFDKTETRLFSFAEPHIKAAIKQSKEGINFESPGDRIVFGYRLDEIVAALDSIGLSGYQIVWSLDGLCTRIQSRQSTSSPSSSAKSIVLPNQAF